MTLSAKPGTWCQPNPEWLSLQQASLSYGISVDTLRRRIRHGQLRASRFGQRLIRVRSVDLDGLLRPIPTVHLANRRLAQGPGLPNRRR